MKTQKLWSLRVFFLTHGQLYKLKDILPPTIDDCLGSSPNKAIIKLRLSLFGWLGHGLLLFHLSETRMVSKRNQKAEGKPQEKLESKAHQLPLPTIFTFSYHFWNPFRSPTGNTTNGLLLARCQLGFCRSLFMLLQLLASANV